jgi:AcrR family transcriptional regulator
MALLRRPKMRPPTSPPAPVGERPVDVRSRLLRAADEILGREGIQALTQTRVAEAAGVRQSHLTYYFGTRSALVRALVEATAIGVMTEVISGADGRAVSLPQMRQRLVDRLSDPTMARRIMGIMLSTDVEPSLQSVLDDLESKVCAFLARSLRQQGVEVSDVDAVLLHSTLVGIALRNFNRSSEEARRKTQSLIGETFDRLVARAEAVPRRSRKLSAVAVRKP